MSEERLNLIKENVYTRCSIANITGIGMTAPDKEEVELIEEIERLNNIINKAKEKSIFLQKRYGYILDDLTYLLMQGSESNE